MKVSKTFKSERELAEFLNKRGLGLNEISGPWINSSNFLFILFEDGSAPSSIRPGGSAGVSYGADAAVASGGSSLIEVGLSESTETDEDLGASGYVATMLLNFTGTLAETYVLPGTVSISDSDGTGPSLQDDGAGTLVETVKGTKRGTINYATGAVDITYPFNPAQRMYLPTGNILATYKHSSLPDSEAVPPRARLSRMVISTPTANVTDVDYEVYEQEDTAAQPPLLTGSASLTNTAPAIIDLGGAISSILEIADMDKRDRRWVKVTPTVAPAAESDIRVRMTWEDLS